MNFGFLCDQFTAQPKAPVFALAGASGWAVNDQINGTHGYPRSGHFRPETVRNFGFERAKLQDPELSPLPSAVLFLPTADRIDHETSRASHSGDPDGRSFHYR